MNKTIVWMFFVLICMQATSIYAQSKRVKELQKQNKEFMKQYKKAHKIKYMFIQEGYDGHWYYFYCVKKNKHGILSKEGKEIVPPIYDFVEYIPPVEEGFHSRYVTNVWSQKTEGVYLAQDYEDLQYHRYTLYKTDGTIVFENLEPVSLNNMAGYFDITCIDKKTGKKVSGLYTSDGREILPINCYFIEIDGKVCKYKQMFGELGKGGNLFTGAIMLDGSIPNIPCQFTDVKYDAENNQWLVMEPEKYEMEPFDPSKHYASNMKDEGVKLYWSGKYDEVIEYYSKEGISKPWAKYYTASSILTKANNLYYNIRRFIEVCKEGKMDHYSYNGVKNRDYYMELNHDFELIKQLYTSGYAMMNAYLLEDIIFEKEAKKETFIGLEHHLELVDNTKAVFGTYWQEFQRQNEAIAAQKAEQIRIKQERRNAIYQAMLQGFINGLNNAISNNASQRTSQKSTINNSQSSNSSVTYNNASYNNNKSTTSSNSNNNSINYSMLADWKARKANAERMINTYNEHLIKYPNDANIKSMLRTQQDILNNCNRQISLIESGQIH